MTKLAQLIAKEEGFFKSGTLPRRRNNPGDLRHAPHASHLGIGRDDIGIEDTAVHGWEDLERQLQIDAARKMSLRDAIYSWAPPNENPTARYLFDVVEGFGGVVDEDMPLSAVLGIAA